MKKNFHQAVKKIKKIFSSKKNRLIALGIFSLFSLIFFFWMSIYGPWYKIWPRDFRFTIALNRLALSTYNDPYCRLECQLYRQKYRQEILKSLNNKKNEEKISKIIFNESENINWRLELTKTIFQYEKISFLEVFTDLQKYLNKYPANLKLQRLVAYNLSADDFKNDNYLEGIKDVLANDGNSASERLSALKNLKNISNYQADFYLALITLEDDEDILIEILRAMGSDLARFDVDRSILFNQLEKIIRSENSSYTSKRLAIFILSDFWPDQDSDDALKLAQRLISSGEIDNFSLYFLVESLRGFLPEDEEIVYRVAEIGAGEWDWYYQQK